jgi:hypothetical protein
MQDGLRDIALVLGAAEITAGRGSEHLKREWQSGRMARGLGCLWLEMGLALMTFGVGGALWQPGTATSTSHNLYHLCHSLPRPDI